MCEFMMRCYVLGMVQTNCYFVWNSLTKDAIVIDPADDVERIEQYLKENGLVCKGILLTHGHFDHMMAARELADRTGAKLYAHAQEEALLKDPKLNVSAQVDREVSLSPDLLICDQEILPLIGMEFTVLHTPGHTGGGVCYYLKKEGIVFSGDTLFFRSIGRTDLPTGDGRTLIESIKNKLMILEDQVKVFPGHGESTTIGYERMNNYYLS